MAIRFRFLFLIISLALNACAIPTRQTDAFLGSPRDIPDGTLLSDVPFVAQDKNYCGPASLAMVMAYAGNPVPEGELAKQAYTPGKKGTLQVDLVGAAKRNGMMAIEIHGLSALLHEVAAGHPVVTFENQGLSWYPRWHYAVAIGYDLSEPQITLHSGGEAQTRKDLRVFERCWMDSNYWGLVVLRPGELAVSADELAHAVAASGLEQVGKTREAELAYQSILKKWPRSFGALIGMGNLRHGTRDHRASVKYLEQAVHAYPESSIAWHNLAIAQGESHQNTRARQSALKAVTLAKGPETDKYRESLAKWLRGD